MTKYIFIFSFLFTVFTFAKPTSQFYCEAEGKIFDGTNCNDPVNEKTCTDYGREWLPSEDESSEKGVCQKIAKPRETNSLCSTLGGKWSPDNKTDLSAKGDAFGLCDRNSGNISSNSKIFEGSDVPFLFIGEVPAGDAPAVERFSVFDNDLFLEVSAKNCPGTWHTEAGSSVGFCEIPLPGSDEFKRDSFWKDVKYETAENLYKEDGKCVRSQNPSGSYTKSSNPCDTEAGKASEQCVGKQTKIQPSIIPHIDPASGKLCGITKALRSFGRAGLSVTSDRFNDLPSSKTKSIIRNTIYGGGAVALVAVGGSADIEVFGVEVTLKHETDWTPRYAYLAPQGKDIAPRDNWSVTYSDRCSILAGKLRCNDKSIIGFAAKLLGVQVENGK